MAEKSDDIYAIPEEPVYNVFIRKLKNSDPANAETIFNPLFQQIIENTHSVKVSSDVLISNFEDYKKEVEEKISSVEQMSVDYDDNTETLIITKYTYGGTSGGYTLPVATSDTLGGVMIGNGINIDTEGHITPDTDAISDNIENKMEEITKEEIKSNTNKLNEIKEKNDSKQKVQDNINKYIGELENRVKTYEK